MLGEAQLLYLANARVDTRWKQASAEYLTINTPRVYVQRWLGVDISDSLSTAHARDHGVIHEFVHVAIHSHMG